MLSKHKRLRALVAMAGLAVSMFAVQAIPAAAQARCLAPFAPQTGTLIHLGDNLVHETPVANTCQGNTYYSTDFHAHTINGVVWRASVWVNITGSGWTGLYGGRNTADVHMEFDDTDPISAMVLCADDGTWWICGYGTNNSQSLGAPNFLHSVLNNGY